MTEQHLRRYHHKIYFPNWDELGRMVLTFLEEINAITEIQPTHHAAQQLLEDKRGIIPLPNKKELCDPTNTLIEFYEILDKENHPTGIIQKALIRIHNLNEKYDYTYLVAKDGWVVTAWAVDKGDEHRLNRTMKEYYCPSNLKKETYSRLKTEYKAFLKKQEK